MRQIVDLLLTDLQTHMSDEAHCWFAADSIKYRPVISKKGLGKLLISCLQTYWLTDLQTLTLTSGLQTYRLTWVMRPIIDVLFIDLQTHLSDEENCWFAADSISYRPVISNKGLGKLLSCLQNKRIKARFYMHTQIVDMLLTDWQTCSFTAFSCNEANPWCTAHRLTDPFYFGDNTNRWCTAYRLKDPPVYHV